MILELDSDKRKAGLRASAAAGTITHLDDEKAAAHASFRKLTARMGKTIRGSWVTVCTPIKFGLK